ncbi:TPA: hypothetical protein ACGQTX_002968 [Raoultella ornithinolytica]|uniref:hypothetical protein n=1 Tax=Raoultella ornithinolytica TaxID=54291 RepID=UPI000F297F05|nr:hypothetical protein [Raoultella ornithinolytica]EKW7680918.1 hypothetical protein [Raoultella ornithinolytica]EKW7684513.1 hypothetical protein [Raoultella ornithinolytica]ELN4409894.1 hypothetical protein [Raoultella ornithinolytica]MCF6684165.1 hypothetical protein [Raoultella ornithinolytica]RLP21592.1 hypothetical protein D9D10_03435 [Raoultella ornithinolytica]
MLIPVTSDGKKLVESGIFNSAVSANNDTTIQFNYNGLRVKLVINIYKDQTNGSPSVSAPDFVATVEEGVVVLKQSYRFIDQPGLSPGYTGMLVPFEVGVKPDQKKIYMTWRIELAKSVGGTLMAIAHYSFYEDE